MDIAKNKKAYFQYQILEKYEAGIVLVGTEVKSCRAYQISMQEAFATIENNEAILHQVHISPYDKGNRFNHTPNRKRKLLLHKREIIKIKKALEADGFTLIPLKFYLKKGKVKVSLGVCRGKKLHDKRETIKKRQSQRDLARIKKQF